MNIPLFHKQIPLLHEQEAPGFYELSFKSLYDADVLSYAKKEIGASLLQVEFHLLIDHDFSVAPTVLVCDRNSVKRKDNENAATNGVYVLVNPKINKGKYDVAVGRSEVAQGNASKPPNEKQQTLMGLIRDLADSPEPKEMKDWKRAILICDWEEDIEKRGARKGKPKTDIDEKNEKALNDEIFHLANLFHNELKKSKALNLDVHGYHRDSYYLPNPDSLRYDYYVGIVKRLLSMIIANEI